MLDIVAICLVITALLAYLNHRYVGLPITIGVMAASLALSLAIIGLDSIGLSFGVRDAEESLLKSIDFGELLMQGMLSLLLFAGALHVHLADLRSFRWQVGGLACVGTLLSTIVVGFGMWFALPFAGVELGLPFCLVFGALISPTDPVAVMGILKSAGAPKNLEVVITGESLFNDGVGIVLFTLLLGVAVGGVHPSAGEVGLTLLHEAGGGLAFGAVLGFVTYRLLKSIDQYQVEVMLTLAAVVGGYALANHLHVSGPLAMVVAGLMIGNRGRKHAMSDTTRQYVDMFWELLDEILNAVLFVLIGMEVLLIKFNGDVLLAGAIAIAVTLAARLFTVGLPFAATERSMRLPKGSWRVLTWGGLRGGISVALALSLPASDARDVVLALTYCVVVFSILVQGLTVSRVVRRALGRGDRGDSH
ncbi:MAG: sodium:proton antiporter [Gammaproteobacteria bacterium]|nr:sodium:proton antiporter [Gammaproteobacteria bacterium]MBU1444005.1 sodium:proton antiporter [Gammaproteobacteria bacterium]MBU2288453.1 sodium:proton antiporter [Gammaproteobacteria bacterium]MBU2411050.1 sodium:proton antiporter [Gammaproteobacteria bacterium]